MAGDTYKTLKQATTNALYKERKSKFYGFAYPVKHKSEIKHIIDDLRKKYPGANHFCYAWKMGTTNPRYRVNDDGEPNNAAGMPIYGQILSFGLTDTLVVVVREFGGIKLGVGGLISAYRAAAKMAIATATIEEKTIKTIFLLQFAYAEMDKVMRLIKKRELEIISQRMELDCQLEIAVRKSEAKHIEVLLNTIQHLKFKQKVFPNN